MWNNVEFGIIWAQVEAVAGYDEYYFRKHENKILDKTGPRTITRLSWLLHARFEFCGNSD